MIRILVDSACDLSEDYIKAHKNLEVIPIPLTHKNKTITGIDLEEFYKLLVETNELPKTSQINPEIYTEYFRKYKDDEIIYISLSSKLSGTFSSANLAKQLLEDEFDTSNIYLFDSESATISQALLVDIALSEIEKNKNVKEILNTLNNAKKKIKLRVIVDELDFLYKGGRLSKTSAVLGNTLNIKPILELSNGEIKVVAKVRGLKKANKTILEEFNEKNIEKVFLGYCTLWDSYDNFKNEIKLPFEEFQIGSIIGTHVGPKCYGIVYLEK